MSATAEDAYARIEALVDANHDARLPRELRDEIEISDFEILEDIAEAGGDDQ